jgi:hypothetical protein
VGGFGQPATQHLGAKQERQCGHRPDHIGLKSCEVSTVTEGKRKKRSEEKRKRREEKECRFEK